MKLYIMKGELPEGASLEEQFEKAKEQGLVTELEIAEGHELRFEDIEALEDIKEFRTSVAERMSWEGFLVKRPEFPAITARDLHLSSPPENTPYRGYMNGRRKYKHS